MASVGHIVIGLFLVFFLGMSMVTFFESGNDRYGTQPDGNYSLFYDSLEANRTSTYLFVQDLESTMSKEGGTVSTFEILNAAGVAVIKSPFTLLKSAMSVLTLASITLGIPVEIFTTVIGVLMLIIIFAVIRGLTGRGDSV